MDIEFLQKFVNRFMILEIIVLCVSLLRKTGAQSAEPIVVS